MAMMKLRLEQYCALRKWFIGEELLRTFDPVGRTARDPATGDIWRRTPRAISRG